MKNLLDKHGIEPAFAHTNSLKRKLLKKLENELDFFSSVTFVIVNSSTINPCHCANRVILVNMALKRTRISRQTPSKIFCKLCSQKGEDHDI